jgi:broad specificity phosphatase PhoE
MTIYFIRHGQSEFNAAFDPTVGDQKFIISQLNHYIQGGELCSPLEPFDSSLPTKFRHQQ